MISCFGMAVQKTCCAALHVQKHLSRPDLEDHLCPCHSMSMSVTLRVDNEGKHASWSGGSSAWDRLPKQVSGLDFNENTCNSPVSFVSVHLAAEVNQAAEDEKEAAECWALSSWSRVCSLHGQRFLDTSRHTLHEFTKLILKRYPIISHHIPSASKSDVSYCFMMFLFLPVFVLYNLSISKTYNAHSCWANKLRRVRLIAWGHVAVMLRSCWDPWIVLKPNHHVLVLIVVTQTYSNFNFILAQVFL